MPEIEFGDITPDDVYTEGDEDVDWSEVDLIDSQIQDIQDIDDGDERLEAAKAWAAELAGD
jgi:hypothetical protein